MIRRSWRKSYERRRMEYVLPMRTTAELVETHSDLADFDDLRRRPSLLAGDVEATRLVIPTDESWRSRWKHGSL